MADPELAKTVEDNIAPGSSPAAVGQHENTGPAAGPSVAFKEEAVDLDAEEKARIIAEQDLQSPLKQVLATTNPFS